MRLIIIGVVLLLLLGGGAGAYFFYFAPKAEAAVGEHAEGDTGEHKEAGAEGEAGHGEGVEYVELDPLILPIVDNEGVSQVVSLVVSIQVDGVLAADKVKSLSPVLKDAYIQDMYGVLNKYAALKGGVIQVSVIKERLNKITKEILGDDITHGVLLQVVQQRPI